MNRKLILIFLIAFILRLYGMNWDSGFHLHPDERMILMVADRIHFFDKLNPHFFNYGSLPIYLLKGTAQVIDFFLPSHYYSSYQGLLYVGRSLSILFDLGTIFLIYKIACLLFSVNVSSPRKRGSRELLNWIPCQARNDSLYYLPSFFYAIAFFPIQNSHFFTVDILFTFLTTLLLYQLLLFTKNQSFKSIFSMGIVFAALLATKFTAIIFLPILLLTVFIKKGFLSSIYSLLSIVFFTFLFMPYAFLDFSQFVHDISLQLMMNKDPYIFPYTLQYVDTLPYWYYLKNIFLWGLGPVISILSLIGLYQILKVKYQNDKLKIKILHFDMSFCFFIFYLSYFLIIGASAVKFMRYMLPIYPFFAIMAGFTLSNIFVRSDKIIGHIIKLSVLSFAAIWTLLFISIYSQPNTRVAATEWILNNIPAGSSLAVEYWDDYLPIYGGNRYHFNELHLYDLPDNDQKWERLDKQLEKSDYIVIASNRLYTPLQKLADCNKFPSCYPKTAEYYQKLFNGRLHLKKVAEFSVKPGLQILNFKLQIDDTSADESFTVFDHPKVMIFRKIN